MSDTTLMLFPIYNKQSKTYSLGNVTTENSEKSFFFRSETFSFPKVVVVKAKRIARCFLFNILDQTESRNGNSPDSPILSRCAI